MYPGTCESASVILNIIATYFEYTKVYKGPYRVPGVARVQHDEFKFASVCVLG